MKKEPGKTAKAAESSSNKNTPPKKSTDLKKSTPEPSSEKIEDLAGNTESGTGEMMSNNQGLRVNDDQNSLKAGDRGATLLEDFILREKITHFDHERIPERVVHARGSGAHGVFTCYESIPELTRAHFLGEAGRETPVFVRFSTVAGSRGSTDLSRDVRGFAVKFYTQEGNFDLVGNNMPVFFIQDAMKFPDLVHAAKPEPDNEMPQAATAHDTFWDFISMMPESAHMIMWAMSDRAIPRSLRMMEGFGVHTFRFITVEGKSSFVKFHWKPLLGVHSVAWDEAQKISGKDPDFHRRDLWDAIEAGAYPEFEFGVQIVAEEDEFKFGFDLLDPTKIIPEELVPVQRIGKMTLNRNPDNFFAETEQVAFHVGHVVPGIDFTNDPLLQGRLFSYTDTQLIRLGGPNFHEFPINRPIVPVHNNQRDGFSRQTINQGKTSYGPNSLSANDPAQVKAADGGFVSYNERIDARKIRARSKSFLDHFSQARLFFQSQSDPEKQHIIDALCFELGKVKTIAIRERMLGILHQVDPELATPVALYLGLSVPKHPAQLNFSVPADADPRDYESVKDVKSDVEQSPALSMAGTIKDTIKTRKIAFLVADGVDEKTITSLKTTLEGQGAVVVLIAPKLGTITAENSVEIPVDESFLTAASVLFDAVYVAGGVNSAAAIEAEPDAIHFLNEAFKHCKAIAAEDSARQVIDATYFGKKISKDQTEKTALDEGVFIAKTSSITSTFVRMIAMHRFWEREKPMKVPA